MLSVSHLYEGLMNTRGNFSLYTGDSIIWGVMLKMGNKKWASIHFDRDDLRKGISCVIDFEDFEYTDPFENPNELKGTATPPNDYKKGTFELKGHFNKDKVDCILILKGSKLNGQYKLIETGKSRFLKRKQYKITKIK